MSIFNLYSGDEEYVVAVLNFLYTNWSRTYRTHGSNFLTYLEDSIAKKRWLEVKCFYFFENGYSLDDNFWAYVSYYEKEEVPPNYDDFSVETLENVKIYYQNQQHNLIPVTVKKTSQQSTGFKIPPPPEPLQFNTERIAEIKTESKKLSAELNTIYEQEETAHVVTNSDVVARQIASEIGLNLDDGHLEIVKILATRHEWGRDELQEIMNGMMIDGVLEHINDAFFDYCDEAFLEGYDPIEIDVELYREIFK
jgi:hypothetical protein